MLGGFISLFLVRLDFFLFFCGSGFVFAAAFAWVTQSLVNGVGNYPFKLSLPFAFAFAFAMFLWLPAPPWLHGGLCCLVQCHSTRWFTKERAPAQSVKPQWCIITNALHAPMSCQAFLQESQQKLQYKLCLITRVTVVWGPRAGIIVM